MTVDLALHRARILESFNEAEVENLAVLGQERGFLKNEKLFREHEAADNLYILLEGRAKGVTRERGRELDSFQYGPGDHFGRATMLEGRLCQISVVALTSGRMFVLSSIGCAALLARMSPARRLVPNITPPPLSRSPDLLDVTAPRSPSSGGDLGRIRSISSAVAGVAHEINTPLGVIENASTFVTEQLAVLNLHPLAAVAESAEILTDVIVACNLIQKNVAHASRLVQSFKKLSVGQLAEPREKADMVRLIHDVLNVFRAKTLSALPPASVSQGPRGQSGLHRLALTSSRLDISVSSPLDETDRIWDGFPGLFSRVLLNLLTNIDRYAYPPADPGRVEITLIRKEPEPGRRGFELSVRDFGRGIPEANLQQVFDPFFTTGRDKGGTGLGLSMVHNLVTQGFDGAVEVTSAVGSGTTFTLWFPERAPDHAPVAAAAASAYAS